MSTHYVHHMPVVVLFDPSEERATILHRFEEFLWQHEPGTDCELHDPDEDKQGRISIAFQVQLSFEAKECDDDHPKPEVVAEWENNMEELLQSVFKVVSVELLDDATILMDCWDD